MSPLQDRAHFFALASRLMRRVLVDHAKSRSRIKRKAGVREFAPEEIAPSAANFDVVALDDALEALMQMEPRFAQVIELHYFGGLTYEQIAAAAGGVDRDGSSRYSARARLAAERNRRRPLDMISARALAADPVAVRAGDRLRPVRTPRHGWRSLCGEDADLRRSVESSSRPMKGPRIRC